MADLRVEVRSGQTVDAGLLFVLLSGADFYVKASRLK
jgi:hypothetical protein